MFISRIPLNIRRRQARFLLSSPHAMHAAVLSSFSPGTVLDDGSGRVLWRVEQRGDYSHWLLVVSPSEPEFIHLAEQAGWPTQHLGESKPYGSFIDRVETGQEWAFQVVANPVHTVTDDRGRKRKLAHVTVPRQQEWFLGRAQDYGFTVAGADTDAPQIEVRDRQIRQFTREGATVTVSYATFVGRLLVTDGNLLQETLRHGMGRAKGYGCGLLTLSRLPG